MKVERKKVSKRERKRKRTDFEGMEKKKQRSFKCLSE
jgi:hypothetical protein